MAQAVFDHHPLDDYLREAGEAELMPGGASDFARIDHDDEQVVQMHWLPLLLIRNIRSVLHTPASSSMFAERFKYDVISSSLLSTTFSASHTTSRLPGRLGSGHSRNTSTATTTSIPFSPPSPGSQHYSPVALALVVIVAVLSAGYAILAVFLLGATVYFTCVYNIDPGPKVDVMTPSFEALGALVSAGKEWDSVVHDAVEILESEERNIFYGPPTPSSPSSSLRVALHSSLHTTQTQCDNVRQLFSALTAPAELAQLSEMYAPPSPVLSFATEAGSSRPRSLPGDARQRTISVPSNSKRATWNGSYAALALAGSPPHPSVLRRREKRRSDLTSLVPATEPRRSSHSAPPTPSPVLDNVQEEEDEHPTDVTSDEDTTLFFGSSALGLRRHRTSGGLNALGKNSSFRPPLSATGSRFTTMHTTRHPLSLSALHHALHGALGARRYACSHLLALRFDDEACTDDPYWEDVRAVMSLLASALGDAAARLGDALEDAERRRAREQAPSPVTPPLVSAPLGLPSALDFAPSSFAPMPSHLSRFAAHVDTIASALSDARTNLEQCVAALRDEQHNPHTTIPATRLPAEAPALQAYERMRRELGLALRECERGRERLLDILAPPRQELPNVQDDEEEDLPALTHDSDSSDKPESTSVSPDFGFVHSTDREENSSVVIAGEDGDDATTHLLLTASSRHLPPPGIEQVFEGEPERVPFTRERSKLTREERIQLAKARRESGQGIGLGLSFESETPIESRKPARELWGPGGDVVQELKDVIWQVAEKRRKMIEGCAPSVLLADAPTPMSQDGVS